jgi:hypothetical protein
MEFKYIENYLEHKNEKDIYNIYGEKQGMIKANYEFVKNNCLKTKTYCLVEKKTEYYTLNWENIYIIYS